MRLVVRALVFLVGVLGLAGANAQELASAGSSEYLIKAGYIYNFAKLVEWPSSPGATAPIVIGVLGNDAFATILDRVVHGKTIDDRPFVVKRLKNKELQDCACQILFVGETESARTDEIVRLQKTASVLTIAEAPDFASRGGIIALVLEDSRVRFMVNVDAAAQASLTISSRLLNLATIVQTSR